MKKKNSRKASAMIILDSLKTHDFSRVMRGKAKLFLHRLNLRFDHMKHNESGIPSSNNPTTLVVGYKEDVIIGAALILAVSLLEGFGNAAANAFYHIIKDVTVELVVHVYIAGIVLVILGLYIHASGRDEKKNSKRK